MLPLQAQRAMRLYQASTPGEKSRGHPGGQMPAHACPLIAHVTVVSIDLGSQVEAAPASDLVLDIDAIRGVR